MLHGCTQTPEDLARGTRMNEEADRRGFAVAYPEQTNRRNPQGCWNWFLAHHQARSSGEPALLAGITQDATARLGPSANAERIFLAGMSAGGAMAVVMGATHPDLFAAIAVHSGLAYGAATSQRTAFEAMARGTNDPGRRGTHAFEAMRERARLMPTIVVHGTRDNVVCPVNGDQVVEQWLATNALATAGSFNGDPKLAPTQSTMAGPSKELILSTRYRWNDSRGRPVQEYMKIEGLAHAWSGGNQLVSHTDKLWLRRDAGRYGNSSPSSGKRRHARTGARARGTRDVPVSTLGNFPRSGCERWRPLETLRGCAAPASWWCWASAGPSRSSLRPRLPRPPSARNVAAACRWR